MNESFNYLGGNNWWVHQNITLAAPTTTLMKNVPAAGGTSVGTTHPGATGASMTYRLVITGYSISATNTNATACQIDIRNTGGTLLITATCAATSGQFAKDNSNVWLPGAANEGIECRTSGALTGNVRITLWGKIFPATTALADFYDGAAH